MQTQAQAQRAENASNCALSFAVSHSFNQLDDWLREKLDEAERVGDHAGVQKYRAEIAALNSKV